MASKKSCVVANCRGEGTTFHICVEAMVSSDFHQYSLVAAPTPEELFSSTSDILHTSSSVDCLSCREVRNCNSCYKLIGLFTMDDMVEQFMSNYTTENLKDHLPKANEHAKDSILKMQTSIYDEWMDSSGLGASNQQEYFQDTSPVITNLIEGSSNQVEHCLSTQYTTTVSDDVQMLLDNISLLGNMPVQNENDIDIVCDIPAATTKRSTSNREQTKNCSAIKARTRKSVAMKRRLLSESQDDSDADSHSCENSTDSPCPERLAAFAQEFIEHGQHAKPSFWQYNIQLRGPKGRRLYDRIEIEDSHVVPDFSDPVFEDFHQLSTWRHNGRARQGDGNDPRPDPMKLLIIGYHIWGVEAKFHGLCGTSFGDDETRSFASKRKNKLASRVCRLKKKALHAANKIKLDGLKQEHGQLMQVIKTLVSEMELFMTTQSTRSAPLCLKLDSLIKKHLTFMIAGNTADYVNAELAKVAQTVISQQQ